MLSHFAGFHFAGFHFTGFHFTGFHLRRATEMNLPFVSEIGSRLWPGKPISGEIGHGKFSLASRLMIRLACTAIFLLSATAASAAPRPIVEFDVADLVACRDVTPDDWKKDDSADRLIEASFSISSLLRRGTDRQVVHFLYRIESPERSLCVVDYLPKTQLATSVVGKVAVEKQREGSSSIGVNVSGKYDRLAAGTLSGSKGSSDRSSLRYELLPPKELVAASGTIDRQHGVYFKLKPSKQTSLEGAKQFVCVFRVDRKWRGGLIRIHCEATAKNPYGTIALPGGQTLVGRVDFTSGLYLKDDRPARLAVAESVAASRHRAVVQRDYEATLEKDFAGQLKQAVDDVATVVRPFRPDRLIRRVTGRSVEFQVDKPVDPRPAVLIEAIAREERAERKLMEINGRSAG